MFSSAVALPPAHMQLPIGTGFHLVGSCQKHFASFCCASAAAAAAATGQDFTHIAASQTANVLPNCVCFTAGGGLLFVQCFLHV